MYVYVPPAYRARALCSVAYFSAVGSLRRFICLGQTALSRANKERLQQQSHLTRELHQSICNAYHGRTMDPSRLFPNVNTTPLAHSPYSILLWIFNANYHQAAPSATRCGLHTAHRLIERENFRSICMQNQVFEQSAHTYIMCMSFVQLDIGSNTVSALKEMRIVCKSTISCTLIPLSVLLWWKSFHRYRFD